MLTPAAHLPSAGTLLGMTECACAHTHTRAQHVFPYVPGYGPVLTCTRFWVACACTQKHSLLQNSPTLDPFGTLSSCQPSLSQALLAWCCAYLQMDSGAAGAFGIGSNRNRGSSRWWWQPQQQRGLQQRRCLLWSWDFRQKTGLLTFQPSERKSSQCWRQLLASRQPQHAKTWGSLRD